MRDLAGRVAVVTGAASGLGRATALRLGRAGMRLVLADIDGDALAAVAAEAAAAGSEQLSVPTDVADSDAMEALRDAAVARFDTVHVVHNNAGVVLPPMPLWTVDEALWRFVLGSNVGGVINGIRTFVPLLVAQGEGHVVNTAALGGFIVGARFGAYSASKYAVVALSEALSADLRAVGSPVGVSVVCPSAVPTNLARTSRDRWPSDVPVPDGADEPRDLAALGLTVLPPDVIADAIHDAVVDDRLYVFTHPETRGLLEERFRKILDAC